LNFLELFVPQKVFIGGWGMKFKIFRFFLNFLDPNGQICMQTIKFEFKWINQELTTHYCPPAPVAGGSAGGTTQALPPGVAPVRAVPPV
jgi:hypothetical protein